MGNSLTLHSSVTVVPLERLTDEELEFHRVLAERGRAIPSFDVSNKGIRLSDRSARIVDAG
ncbi:MAG TPA: hypothetical protein VGY48_06190 [Vicinamibacterales bacterium]|nr:hypothetical protein [Vicinamibacterales bacterium]